MNVNDIMTPNPSCCSSDSSLREVAQTMRENDCGAVPIVDDGQVVGIVTDRDLAIRALANGMDADSKVEDIITRGLSCCSPTDDVRDVGRLMSDRQVRRVPIVDADGCCVGIVSQADLARAAKDGEPVSERDIAMVVERISEPSREVFGGGRAA